MSEKEQVLRPIVDVRYPDTDDIEQGYRCPMCQGLMHLYRGDRFCRNCGSRLVWNCYKTDPNERILCDFCGKNRNEVRMIEGGRGRICFDCAYESAKIANFESQESKSSVLGLA